MSAPLAAAGSGHKSPLTRQSYTATVDGRIAGIGKTISIESITVHYDLTMPPEFREPTGRALRAHTIGCPAHQSVKDAIAITLDATLPLGNQVLLVTTPVEPSPHPRHSP